MKIDATPSQIATSALTGIPFSQIIGSPLKAAIEAQAMAAETTWRFIQEVGLNIDKESGEKKAVSVAFEFIQDGKEVRLNVPLLTIVPIPYIAINSIDIAFKAKINAESSAHNEKSKSNSTDASGKTSGKVGFGCFSATFEASASYSSKKDSKATQDSKYSVEYTLDIAVKAGQDSMPAGLARVLDILNNCIAVSDPKGELGASISEGDDGKLQLIATYKNSDGIFKPELIKAGELTATISDDGRSAIFDVEASRGKELEVKAENVQPKKLPVPAK
ncbi:MAG: DUF2589 domain-containing protein [Dysgonamonadaceae bacterium]|jgi:hypothetical protein|nr:DUF2589 domain-containing protein [Dysgonamonadaceae bacterium]